MPLKSLTLGKATVIKRSRNSYILSPLKVTFAPIGTLALNLKLETSILDLVDIAF